MALGTPSEEKQKLELAIKHRKALDDRMDKHLDLFRLAPFRIPKEEGEWENFTTNSPSVLGNKVIHICSNANRRLFIPLTEDLNNGQRDSIGQTERLVNGLISQGDFLLSQMPEELISQEAMAFYGAVMGFIILRYVQLPGEEDDIIPDLGVWNPRMSYWLSGKRGLLKIFHQRYATAESVEDEYNTKVTPDEDGNVVVIDVFDRDEEGVCIGTPNSDGTISDITEWIVKDPHGLGRVPAGVFPVGSVPLLQGKAKDLIKAWGQSVYTNNEHLYQIESRLLSYKLTRAGIEAKDPMLALYDSKKDGKPIEFPEDPYVKGRYIPVDTGKGQDTKSAITPKPGNTISELIAKVDAMDSMGGMAPIAYGEINQDLPASGIVSLIKASLERVYPVKKAMERAYAWLASEVVKQFADNEDVTSIKVEGKDSKNNRYRSDIKKDNVDSKWRFDCDLALESTQMELEMAGIILPLIKAKFISYQTAREHFPWINDPDLEGEIIDRESTEEITGLKLRRTAAALLKDGDVEGAMLILQQLENAEQPQQGVSNAGLPSPQPVGTMAGARASQPGNMAEQMRLKRLNLVRG